MQNSGLDALAPRAQATTKSSRLKVGLDNIKQAAQLAAALNNPDRAAAAMAMQNPLMRQAQEIAAQFGGDYDKAFLATCQQNGIDPMELAKTIKSLL